MKKRLLSALLALALVFVLLPTTALAEVVSNYFDCDISILGNYWKFEKDSNNEYLPVYYRSEASSFEDSTVAPENNYLEIRKTGEKEITITVHGDVNITATGISIDTIAASKSVIINGNGHLTVKYTWIKSGQNYSAIGVSTLTVEGVALSAEASMGPALSATYGIHIKDGAMVEAKAGYYEAVCEGTTNKPGGITVDNATLVATATGGGNCSAIKTYGDIAFTNAKVTATNKSSKNAAIQAKTYEGTLKYLYVSGTSTITATNQSTSTDTMARAIGATIKNNNTSEKIEVGSSKVDAGKTWYTNAKQVTITSPALEKDSYVSIAGDPAVVGVETSIPSANGSGTYFYDQASKTLTLNNVTINKTSNNAAKAIQFDKNNGTYTVNLVGTNTISNVSYGISTNSAYSEATSMSVTITGSGSLDISAKAYAIEVPKGDLTFNGAGEIKLTTGYTYPASTLNALYVVGNVTIDKTKYDIKGEKQAQGFPTEDIGNSPVFETILKGTSTDKDLYFKSITIAPKSSETYYNDTAMKYGETRNAGSGTISCDENGVITLNGATAGTLEFRSSADSTLVLEGTSTLSSIVTTQKGLTISGSGSLTVGSIKVHNQKDDKPNLTINGATVTVGTAELTTRAIDIDGNLTVTNGSLKATSTSDSVPTVQVGGNASFTGSTVTIINNSTALHKDAAGSTKGDSVSSALYVKGNINTDNANVTAKVENGGGNAIGAVGNITVNGSTVTAVNKGQKFTTIIAKYVYVSGDSKITANNLNENPVYNGSYLAFPAIEGNIVNQNTDYSLKFEGQHSRTSVPKTTLAPGEQTTLYYYNVTITRGDEVVRTPSPVVIAGTTLLNDTYYTINGSTVAEGTEDNYNAFYNSTTKTLKLNNAKISTTTKNAAIKISEDLTITVTGTNELKGNYNHCIESYNNFTINGTGTLNMTNTNSSSSAASVIYCGPYKNLTIAAEVIIKNEAQPGNLIFTVEKDAYSFAEGYNVYASTDVSGSPLETYDAANSSTYQYLRITKENLAPTTPTPQTPFTIYGIPAQFVDGGMIATTGVTATSSNNINLPIDRVKWYTFTPVFGSDGRMDSVSDKTEATGNFEAGKYYVVEIKFVQDLSPFKSWDMKVSGWSDNDVYRQSVTARNDIEIYFLTPASAATHEHNWAENYDTVYHWKMCTYDGCTAIKDKALHVWNAWHTSNNEQQHWKSCSECSYSTPPHDIDLAYVSDGEQGHHLYCKHDGCTFVTGTTAHVYAEGSNICTDCGYNKSAPCDHTGDRAYTNNGDGTHKVTCKACGATIVEKQSHEFGPTGACIYCGATQSGGDPTPDNPGTIVIIRPAEEEKPAQQPNPSTGANDLVGLAVAAAVAAALGSAALLRKHD